MEWIVISVYSLSLLIVTIFSLGQLNLTLHYLKRTKKVDMPLPDGYYPEVTVQLPVFNEKYVIKRLIDAVCALDYPLSRLEIQVLDDSDDQTAALTDHLIREKRYQGINIKAFRRKDRIGFKAGALQHGLEKANGEFIAIFDADFLPRPDFLKRTLGSFQDSNIGMVQTRWEHINKDYSILTRMQAFGLDAHFTIEQGGRNAAGSFMNFNGTAGVWRTTCIKEAGGWQHDTLTEDLDLSYRAQLLGWKFKYLENVGAPAELPVVVPAIKSQQYRWNKGAAETARKNLAKVLRSDLSFEHKFRAILHLLNSSVFFFLLLSAILSIPMLFLKESNPALRLIFDLGSIFIIGFIAIAIFYWYASKNTQNGFVLKYYLLNFPLFLSFSMGLALHNSMAILEGFLGKKSEFIRTPKFNILHRTDKWQGNHYLKNIISGVTIMEGILMCYFIFGVASGIYLGDYGLILFHTMLSVGFGLVFFHTIKSFQNA